MEILNGTQRAVQSAQVSNSSPIGPQRSHPQHLHGLPTPASSTELRAQANHEYVSPMMLQQQTPSFPMSALPHHFSQARSPIPSSHMQQLSNSAPANIAFQMTSMAADTDFDVSPLTSPWLGAYTQQPPAPVISNKRSASPSDEDSSNKPASKRRSSIASAIVRKRASKSATSTPMTITSNLAGAGSSSHDFSMPPPANPSPPPNGTSNAEPKKLDPVDAEETIAPVTPASIMNLGRLGVNSSLVPPKTRASEKKNKVTSTPKTKPVTDPKATKKPSVVSPNLKHILPAEATPIQPQPPVVIKKTSHKDAEQKRRDSLKTSFDDLRLLLPPIPLPSEEGSLEPLLPGAMPPRGPPRPGGGPNTSVSKLQLLRYGNDYIRLLKGRVERRDVEIEKLRTEVRRLRLLVPDGVDGGGSNLDLDIDLDAYEKEESTMSSYVSDVMEGDEGNE
ncbi:hypothetical protein BDM02DRAFT_2797038 [Thelephora ganbajun]|uniref:Uncharacterized protein n=1 Tax=Thelephora ganbajun TaxID=370292 RepID=A0ACB6ZU20_THEGA|nr:hypothetical protein BDM02DRAFT_2797038 [Thelephora ganbajun]